LRRPAEFADAQDYRVLERVALGKVADEGRDGRIEHALQAGANLVIVGVAVPARERDLDAAHADIQ
jgi:hypothetical protein